MSPFAASNFDSPLAAQSEAGNDSEWHFRMNSCSVQLQLRNVSTADWACKSFCKSNEFSQLRRCLSCKVQMDQPSTSRAERGTNAKTEAQLLCLTLSWYPKIGYLLSRSVGAVSSVTVAALHRYVYQIGFCHPTGLLSSGFPVDALWTRPVWKFFSWAGWHGSRRDWSGGGYILKPWPPQTWIYYKYIYSIAPKKVSDVLRH